MRYALLALVLALLIACEEPTPPVTTSAPAPTTTSTAPEERLSLAHSFPVGETLTYEFDLRRDISLTPEGTPEAPLGELSVPARLTIEVAGTVNFEIREGPESGTFRLDAETVPDSTTVEGTVDGEPIEDEEVALDAIGGLAPAATHVVVDATGATMPVEAGASLDVIPAPLTGVGPGFLGPVFGDGEVAVGEEWTVERSGGAVVGIESGWVTTGRVAGQEDELVLVEGESETEGEEVDLTDFYRDFLRSFQEGNDVGEARLALRLEPTSVSWSGRFDPARGRLVSSTMAAATVVVVEGSAPDRPTGETAAFQVRVEVRDGVDTRAVPPGE